MQVCKALCDLALTYISVLISFHSPPHFLGSTLSVLYCYCYWKIYQAYCLFSHFESAAHSA